MNTFVKAALNMSSLNPDGKVTIGENIVLQMQASPYFDPASLPLPYLSVSGALAGLHTSIITAGSGAPGAISNVHKKEQVVVSIFNLLRAYVEMVANDTSDPKTVIESAGMTVRIGAGGTAVSEPTLTAIGREPSKCRCPACPARLRLCTSTVPTAELPGWNWNAASWPRCSLKTKHLHPFSISAMRPSVKAKALFRRLKVRAYCRDCS